MKKILSIFIALVFAALPVVAIAKRQAIFDWWRLRDYAPSSRIAELASNTTLTDNGRHLFYVYHAELQDSAAFNASCDFSEQSIVLGCYVSGQGIYIFDVTDERLKGIHEVTAAHEVLHAAYERLGAKEQTRIDTLTQQTLDGITDQRIKDTVESYRKRDASIVPNELHSILGTEVSELPAELEQHYAKYFKDRQVVVNFSKQYEQAFTERESRRLELKARLDELDITIKNLLEKLNQQSANLSAEYEALERSRDGAEASTFNARVRQYNFEARQYQAQVAEFNKLIEEHSLLREEHNKLAGEEQELIEAIDSRPETIQQQ